MQILQLPGELFFVLVAAGLGAFVCFVLFLGGVFLQAVMVGILNAPPKVKAPRLTLRKRFSDWRKRRRASPRKASLLARLRSWKRKPKTS